MDRRRKHCTWRRSTLLCLVFLLSVSSKGFVTSSPVDEDLTTTAASDYEELDDDNFEEYHDLELTEGMEDEYLQSGEKLQFRCRVSVVPKRDLTFTWYKDNMKIKTGEDERLSMKEREWGSRLQILDVYTADSGEYRCEASDGEKSVFTTARLTVAFNTPPDSGDTNIDSEIFEGKCELYEGYACAQYLKGKYIYVESFQDQKQMEQQITAALTLVGDKNRVSEECAEYARPAFCHFVFPLCEVINDETTDEGFVYEDYSFVDSGTILEDDDNLANADGTATAVRLCREDCELLQFDVCAKEFGTEDEVIKQLVKTADCSRLPRTTSTGAKCSRLGLKSVVDRTHVCYNDTGTGYQGVVATSQSGEKCKPWPPKMLVEYPELAGGHNFCRNPGNAMDQPWCYTDRDRISRDPCEIPKCKSSLGGGSSDLLMILIPCVSIPLLIGCIMVVMCFVCKKGKGKDIKHTPGKKVELKTIPSQRNRVPELSSTMVHFAVELGEGKYGKVYKAQIMSNMVYAPQEPVAVKTLAGGAMQSQISDFQREMEMFSDLQHVNVSCLKAVVSQPTMRCMIFEYTSRVDLHELLTLHSPHSDIGGKMSGSASSHTSSSLESGDFLHMAVQVGAGLEYLASNNFVHRDLAARNILVCNNNVMKISNLGVVRDCYLSSYYRSPQGGHMLPVRWMAPESLNQNMFSEKSVVWSFGVMMWEMFAYGMQPYCGYSNHEVIDMISKGQTLSCPENCSSRVYSLMRECWEIDPAQRPTCKDVHAKLSGWEGASTTRMTSQLAQGIHRQLTNVMREGAPFGQYTPPQGTVIDGFNQPYMSPPQPCPPHASPASQPYYTSPSTNSSSGMMPGQPPSYPSYMQQPHAYAPVQMYPQPQMHYSRPHPASYPYKSSHTHSSSRSTDSCGSSTRNQLHGHRHQGGVTQSAPQQFQNPQNHYQPQIPGTAEQPEYENFHRTPDSGIHSSKGTDGTQQNHGENYGSGHGSMTSASPPPAPTRQRPGSEVIAPGAQEGLRQPLSVYNNSQHSNSASNVSTKPVVAPKPPISPMDPNRPRTNIVMGVNGQRNRNHNNHIDGPKTETQQQGGTPNRLQANRTSTSGNILELPAENEKQKNSASGKAMSCDSGLPNDEPDVVDSTETQPFIPQQSNARVSYKANKAVITIPGSSSSSMSGSTAVTTESRLT
ncbi:inactive tyrosine-protein kinase transmembrane receptor ROR1-like [Styela clava]